MLDQVIYTRCLPYRNLKANGAVVRSDGFGTHTMSQAIFDPAKKINYDYLQTRLVPRNASLDPKGDKTEPKADQKEPGLLSSYEYCKVGENTYAMIFEFNRAHCTVPRKNGKGHRDGTFIKQALVGNIEGYPCDFFGADCWDAWKKSENDFYLDESPNAEPAWLPQLPAAAKGGSITRESVRSFVRDGRMDAVKAAVWYLLQQYELPVGERKVLLIRDIPANVELWVSAIQLGFSEAMAREITFSTNRSKVGSQPDNVLFYYTDASGKFYPMLNRSIPMSRVPHNMIVGYHPGDRFSIAVKQMPTSNFVILDGENKSIGVQPDSTIHRPYYSSLVHYDEDMVDFTKVILPGLPLNKITAQLPVLFDAYKYLLDSNHKSEKWSYEDALKYLNALTQYGTFTNYHLNDYLLKECIRAYGRFMNKDEGSGYPMLKVMWKFASATHAEQDVIGCVADQLAEAIHLLPARGNMLKKSWTSIKSGNITSIVQPALRDLFSDAELKHYSDQFPQSDTASVGTVLDMFLTAVSRESGGIGSIMSSRSKFEFLCFGFLAMQADPKELGTALNRISGSEKLLNAVAYAVSKELDKRNPGSSSKWWAQIIDVSGGNVANLCRNLIAAPGTGIALIEQLLVSGIDRSRKCTVELRSTFEQALKKLGMENTTGVAFFTAWIKAADVREVDEIVHSARNWALPMSAQQDIFGILDNHLPEEIISGINEPRKRAVQQWATELGRYSKTIALAELNRKLEKERKAERLIEYVNTFAQYGFVADESILDSDVFGNMVSSAVDFSDGELHQRLLCMFHFSDKQFMAKFIKTYVSDVMGETKGGKQLDQVAALTGAMIMDYGNPYHAHCNDVQDALRAALDRTLEDFYRPNWQDKLLKSAYPLQVKKELQTIFKKCAANSSNSASFSDVLGRIAGSLSGFFGENDRNHKK